LIVVGIVCSGVLVAAADKKILRARLDEEVVNLDPAQLSTSADRLVDQQVIEGLVQYDWSASPPYPVKGRLATSYEISQDGHEIVFHLAQGVQFHRGYGEMTSEDVVFSLLRHKDKAVGSVAASMFVDVTEVVALDRYTVKVSMATSGASSLVLDMGWHSGGMILSKKATQELGTQITTVPIGTGPYALKEWKPGVGVFLEAFREYWGCPDWGFGSPKFDEVHLLLIPDDMIALEAINKGELDCLALLQKGSIPIAQSMKDVSVTWSTAGTRQHIIHFNHTIPPFNDVRVRQALCYALDLKTIADRLGAMQKWFPSPFNEATLAATTEFWKYDYNPDLAKSLLAAAGYSNGMTITYIYPKVDMFEDVTLEVVKYWRDIGVKVELQVVEYGLMRKKIAEMKHNVVIWSMTRYTPLLFAQCYLTGSARNYSGYANPLYDQLVYSAQNEPDLKRQKTLWEAVQKMATDDAVAFWPALQIIIHVTSNRVQGATEIPFPSLYDFATARPAQ
jgi:peptide/nickel transport system substrate-binding protein